MSKCDNQLRILNAGAGGGSGGGGGSGLIEGGGTFATGGALTGSSNGTVVTGHTTQFFKGAYSEFFSSTSAAANGILVGIGDIPIGRPYLIDIAIGAAASEVIIIPDIAIRCSNAIQSFGTIFVPCNIPEGSRVAVRCSSNASLAEVPLTLHILEGNSGGTFDVENAGSDLAAALGTKATVSVANTKTAYVELTAATTSAFSQLILMIEPFSASDANCLLDVAVGSAGSEVDIIENLLVPIESGHDVGWTATAPLPVSIPAGSRLSFRFQADTISGTPDMFLSLLGTFPTPV